MDSPDGGTKPAAKGQREKEAQRATQTLAQANHAPAPAPANGKPGRKRRKRKRGRKVFARDNLNQQQALSGQTQAGDLQGKQRNGATGADDRHSESVELGARPEARTDAPLITPQPDQARRPDKSDRPHASHMVQSSYAGHSTQTGHSSRTTPRWRDQQPLYAALDLGTNNCRLLIAAPTRPGQFRVVDAFSRIVRLGEGLTASGRLADAAMDRAVEALKICAGKLTGRPVRFARLIATEACRSAENGAAFLARVEAETGLGLEIIDRETEARLAVSGCGSLIERETQGVVLFDIGGGSSEIALIDLSGKRTPRLANHIVAWTSLPVGVVSLAERFGGRDVTAQSYEAMVMDVAGMIGRFESRDRLGALAAGANFHLLGTSGTVTTLAGVYLGLEKYERRRVDGLWMTSADVDAMSQKLLSWDFAARVANPCIGADRADLVLAGCAILEAIRRTWPSERLRVADRGLREGILSELMAQDGAWRRGRSPWR